MSTRIRKASALAAGFVFLGFAVSGCEQLAGPIGPSSLPAAITVKPVDEGITPPQTPAPVLVGEDSDLQMAPLCGSAAARFDARRWATQGPGGRPVCR